MRPFTFTWLPGRYDKPPALVAHDWRTFRHDGGGIAGTELGDRDRSKATREDGWSHTPWLGEGKGECVVSLDKSRWRVVESKPLELLRPRLPGMTARQRVGNYAATVVAEDPACEQLIVSVAHKLAHVEGSWGRRTREVIMWRRCARRWAKQIGRLRKRYPDAEVLLVADWNLNQRRRWVRFAIRRTMRKAGKDLRIVAPRTGTHGYRVIDFSLTTLHGSAVTRNAKASDHKAVVFDFKERATSA